MSVGDLDKIVDEMEASLARFEPVMTAETRKVFDLMVATMRGFVACLADDIAQAELRAAKAASRR